MKKILLATDFSNDAQKAFEYSLYFAKKFDAEILVLHTYLPTYVDPSTPIDIVSNLQNELVDSLKAQLSDLIDIAQEEGVKATSKLMYSDIKSGVISTVKEENCDLIIIGKTGDTGFLYKLIGSNASALVNSTTVPLLMVPASTEKIEIEKCLYGTQLEFDELEQLAEASKFADKLNAKLLLGHIIADFEPDIQPDNQYLDEIKTAFEDIEIITENTASVTGGLLSIAHTEKADLLIVASHHRNFITQLIDPSKSQKLVNKADLPVLIYHFG